ncbi:hypothetical protein LLEC1_04690 [Akanthomyces lecanii]|uniref:non-specific serine/threonine protein kinase n=1 Tax=Cordyceps confragosa TaxID=2714763 RepID=A0A179I867_CORDF|nr:hypothetical protein LLEC1_04690 [Akanthomyces lecanii]
MDILEFTTEPESNLTYTQEKLADYCPGGYHPVCLGDKFHDGRYEVVHKLGWGGFSTVWLGRDKQAEKWVALKICKADTDSLREVSTLRSLQNSPAANFVARLYDSFVHDGPNGSHLCIVTEFLGPSLHHIIADYAHDDTLRLSRQLLQAIAALHEAGVAHGGITLDRSIAKSENQSTNIHVLDVNASNIVFTVSRLASLSKEELFEIVGAPETAQLLREDGSTLSRTLPKQLVGTMQWTSWIDEDEEDIRLVDWGEAFTFDSPPKRLAQPSHLRVPETLFTSQIDYSIDLWRAGIMMYYMISGNYPFHWWGHNEAFICQMIGFIGELPVEWRGQWQQMQEATTEKIDFLHRPSLLDRYTKIAPKPCLAPVVPVIQKLISFRPADRISAREALELLPTEFPESPEPDATLRIL